MFICRNNTRSARKYSDSLNNPYETTMAPYQTTVMLEDSREGQDVVEVQILPQVIIILFCFTSYRTIFLCIIIITYYICYLINICIYHIFYTYYLYNAISYFMGVT